MILAKCFTILLLSFREVITSDIFGTSDISSFSDAVIITLILLLIRFASDFVFGSVILVISVSGTIISYNIRIINNEISEYGAADSSLSNIFIRDNLLSHNMSFGRTTST